MLYIVECSYNDPQSEAEWNAFYSQQKLPALLSVNGFSTSQRFRTVKFGCPVYLAIQTVRDERVLSSEDYRLKGGGNFSRWQACITDWHRNLYICEEPTPAISSQEILLFSAQPIDYLNTVLGYRALEMQAIALDKLPERRVAYALPCNIALLFTDRSDVCLYQPITPQLHSSVNVDQQNGE